MTWKTLFENPWGSSPPTLTESQSRRRVADLRRRGYKVKQVKLADGTTVVLKSKKRRENPLTTITPAEWWRTIPIGQRVRVTAHGPDKRYAGQEGVFHGFSKPQGYAIVMSGRKRLLFHPESLEPVG